VKNFARELVCAAATEPPTKPWHDWVGLGLVPAAVSTALLGMGLLLELVQVHFNT
jgi:hypothetical protein